MVNQEIVNSLKNAEGVMLQIISLEEEKARKKDKIEQLQGLINQKIKFPSWVISAGFATYVGLCVLMAMFIYMIGQSKTETLVAFSSILSFLLAAFFWTIKGYKIKLTNQKEHKNKVQNNYNPQINQIQNEIDSLQTQIYTIMHENKEILDVLPAKYQYLFAYQKIASYFEDMRASNLSEAINLYETELHRLKLEETSAKALELQKQTKDATDRAATAATWAATASTITAIRSFRK